MAGLTVPVICIVIGEGGSGGALGLGVGDYIHMLENSTYSVITPEGALAILWKDAGKAKEAAEAMKITAKRFERIKIPFFKTVRKYRLNDSKTFEQLNGISKDELIENVMKNI